MGDSRDSSFHISASALSLLALDDGARQELSHDSHRGLRGVAVWMVCCAMLHRFDVPHFIQASGYALVAEVGDVDMFVINQLNTSPLWKVRALQFTRGLS